MAEATSLDAPEAPGNSGRGLSASQSVDFTEFDLIGGVAAPVEGMSQTATELLNYTLHSDTNTHSSEGHLAQSQNTQRSRRWYRTPSPWWILPLTSFSAFMFSSTIGPRTQIYIQLACEQHYPEFYAGILVNNPVYELRNRTPTSETSLPLLSRRHGSLEGTNTKWLPITYSDNASGEISDTDAPGAAATSRPSSGNSRCSKDPVVLSAVARLVTVTSLIVGILTCLTAGWWGELSDRYGRRRVIMCSMVGILCTEANVILVSLMRSRLPGGYWFLILSSIIDGLCGGIATASATAHAYVADCTEPSARSRYFSMYMGILFVGMAAGPSVGSLLVSYTQDLLSVFYLALSIHAATLVFIWAVLPESISRDIIRKLAEERERRAKEIEAARRRALEAGIIPSYRLRLAWLAAFLKPLRIFLPKPHPNGRPGKNWNPLYLAAVYGIMISYISLLQYKSQYAVATFGWGAEELGYWLSTVGFARALHLIVIMPVIIRFLKPVTQPIYLHEDNSTQSAGGIEAHPPPTSTSSYPIPEDRKAAQFDLQIARVSLSVEMIAYVGLALSVTPRMFILSSVLASFGGGLLPAIQSMALFLTKDDNHEAGRVFGALSVMQALGSQIIGPALFGTIYISTVESYPSAIFLVAGCGTALALLLLVLLHLHPEDPAGNEIRP